MKNDLKKQKEIHEETNTYITNYTRDSVTLLPSFFVYIRSIRFPFLIDTQIIMAYNKAHTQITVLMAV